MNDAMLQKTFLSMGPEKLGILFLIAFTLFLASVLVALDARDRGLNKFACVAWFFAVLILSNPPIGVFAYILARRFLNKRKPSQDTIQNVQASAEIVLQASCPYCSTPCAAEAKICHSCGRLI